MKNNKIAIISRNYFNHLTILFATLDVPSKETVSFPQQRFSICMSKVDDREHTFRSSKIKRYKEHLSGKNSMIFHASVRHAYRKDADVVGPRPRYPSSEGLTEYNRQRTVGTYRKPCGRGSSVHRLPSCRAAYLNARGLLCVHSKHLTRRF